MSIKISYNKFGNILFLKQVKVEMIVTPPNDAQEQQREIQIIHMHGSNLSVDEVRDVIARPDFHNAIVCDARFDHEKVQNTNNT